MKKSKPKKSFKNILADYESQSNWLLSLIMDPTGSRYHEEKSEQQRNQEFDEQMARTADFLEFIGNPEAKFKSIHVAGTSGKGSVVSMIAAILSSSQIKTGFHISPYLQVSNEKLIIDNQMISPSEFIERINEWVDSKQGDIEKGTYTRQGMDAGDTLKLKVQIGSGQTEKTVSLSGSNSAFFKGIFI